MKRIAAAILILIAGLAVNCRSRGPQIKAPRENTARTEFHTEPAKVIPWFYGSVSATAGIDGKDARDWNQPGAGVGVLVNSKLDPQWNGHKFFYYYIDFDASYKKFPDTPTTTGNNWIYSTYPGVMFRTYAPYLFKMHLGMGMNLRFNERYYDRWGVYGMMGLELWGFTVSAIVIGHPGQLNWESEYRAGYMWAPVEWR